MPPSTFPPNASEPIVTSLSTPRALAYSTAMIVLSTLGTGYFLGLFSPSITAEFGTDQSTIGFIFALSTLAAVVPMFYLGGLVDRISLRSYTLILLAIFSVASLCVAFAPNLLVFAIGILFVRLLGDWLFTHAALTASVRLLDGRKKALAGLPSLGYALGPSILPALAVLLLGIYGWRTTWLGIALATAVVAIPAFLWLLASECRTGIDAPAVARPRLAIDHAVLPYLPALMCVPLIFSGMLFHQSVWLDQRGAADWIAIGLAAYAIAQTTAMLISGVLVDRFSARRVVALYALPAALGMGVALVGSPDWTILGYFVGAGFATGLYFACTPHLLAELYGKARLGSARAAVQCVTLVCSAASTIGLGVWTDAGLSISIVLVAGIVVIAVTSLIALLASH